jgi:hypothetical protein
VSGALLINNHSLWRSVIALPACGATEGELKVMLKPYHSDAMAHWPVDRRVGDVRNDSPDLFAPLPELPLSDEVIDEGLAARAAPG